MKKKQRMFTALAVSLLAAGLFGCASTETENEAGGVPADLKLIEEETVSPNEAYVDDEADIVNYTVEVYQDDEYDIWVYASSNSAFLNLCSMNGHTIRRSQRRMSASRGRP